MKIDLSVEQLIRDIANSIRMDYSDDNIERCYDYARENHVVFTLNKRPLRIFRYLDCAEEAEKLFNELFVKDDRILNTFKKFAIGRHYADAAIKLNKYDYSRPTPMLLLYKSKDEYIKEIIHKYCKYIEYEAKNKICGGDTISYIDLGDLKGDFDDREFYYDAFIEDDTVLKTLKSFSKKHGYVDVKIKLDYNDFPKFWLYKIDINKK